MTEERHLVAVYGTLKSGRRLHRTLTYTGTSKFIGEGYFKGKIYTNGSYPAVKKGNDNVMCEVYEVDKNTMDILDDIENEGYFYKRQITEIFTEKSKNPIYAWVYFYIDENSLKPFLWRQILKNEKGYCEF